MSKEKKHIISKVLPGSIAEEMGLEIGDAITKVNNEPIEDIFDFQFLMQDEYVEVTVLTKDGEEAVLEIDKEYDEDLGVEFENGLMDDYRSCSNKCIFCFIDQMPKGMRETLYFKDDDSRLSFLQGNYVTLTNMSEHDIERIIKYRLEPINVSFQTTNPELRCMMLHNRFAGDALQKARRLYEAGIQMNGQVVLCKGVNDGKELARTISDLYEYLPVVQSVSVVPVGLSKYRDGLYPLEPFEKEDAEAVIDLIETWQKKAFEEFGLHFIHASDEWYVLADRELPEEERYDGYLQLENGVGMLRLMLNEFHQRLEELKKGGFVPTPEKVTLATGRLVYPYIKKMANRIMEVYPQMDLQVVAIRNDFFGERITVSGLLTGQDIIAQCKVLDLGHRLILPGNVLRSGEEVFLDDYTLTQVRETLGTQIDIVEGSGKSFVDTVLRV
jgi:putative radical SAM enzyme (TIGR03279 family)